MMGFANTALSDDWPMSLEDARRILKGEAGPVSRDKAVAAVFGEISRLNGVINTQARIIADVRKAIK